MEIGIDNTYMTLDDAKRLFFSGNRHDAAKDILVTEARLEHLEHEVPTCVR